MATLAEDRLTWDDGATRRPADGDGIHISLPLRPVTLLKVLLGVSTALAAISAFFACARVFGVHIPAEQLARRMDVDAESTVPSWFSAMDLAFCALLIASLAV